MLSPRPLLASAGSPIAGLKRSLAVPEAGGSEASGPRTACSVCAAGLTEHALLRPSVLTAFFLLKREENLFCETLVSLIFLYTYKSLIRGLIIGPDKSI